MSIRMGFPSDSVRFLAGTAMRTLRIRPLSLVSNLRYVIYECFIFFSRAPQNPKFDLFSVKFFKPEASVHLGMFQKMTAKHFSWAGIVLKLLALFMNAVITGAKFTGLKQWNALIVSRYG